MPVVYVACPYAPRKWKFWPFNKLAIRRNVQRAAKVAAELVKQGWTVLAPTVQGHYIQGAGAGQPEQQWKKMDEELLARCDAFYIVDYSPGVESELQLAKANGLAILGLVRPDDVVYPAKPEAEITPEQYGLDEVLTALSPKEEILPSPTTQGALELQEPANRHERMRLVDTLRDLAEDVYEILKDSRRPLTLHTVSEILHQRGKIAKPMSTRMLQRFAKVLAEDRRFYCDRRSGIGHWSVASVTAKKSR